MLDKHGRLIQKDDQIDLTFKVIIACRELVVLQCVEYPAFRVHVPSYRLKDMAFNPREGEGCKEVEIPVYVGE